MSIAYQCRELVVGPTVGYQVGGQGDGSGYLRQQTHQQPHQQQQVPHQQGAVVRGLSCISIYVNSDEKGPPFWKDTSDGLGEDTHEVFNSVGKEKALMDPHQMPGGAAASLLLVASKDSGLNLGTEFKVVTGDSKNIGVKTGVIGDARLVHHSSVVSNPKDDSVSDASSSIGRNDSLHSTDDDDDTAGDMEVESKLKGPLDSLTELENSLPIKCIMNIIRTHDCPVDPSKMNVFFATLKYKEEAYQIFSPESQNLLHAWQMLFLSRTLPNQIIRTARDGEICCIPVAWIGIVFPIHEIAVLAYTRKGFILAKAHLPLLLQ